MTDSAPLCGFLSRYDFTASDSWFGIIVSISDLF